MKIVLTTYPNKPKELKKFILQILWKRLAKCINRINYMKSYYFFEWKINTDEEKLVIIKTTDDKIESLKNFIENNHPYKIPEIVIINPEDVNNSYLNWINEK